MAEVREGRSRKLGALATAIAVVLQGAAAAWIYPNAYLDADLLSYLAYFREWSDGVPARFGYTVPKVLPVALFGPTGSPEASFALSLLVAAMGGSFAFALADRLFGRAVAVLVALAYVFDPLRTVLTLRSSADLVVGVGLLGAMWALGSGRLYAASAALLIAALAKPLAVVCGLPLLFAPGRSWRDRILASALPLVAVPAVAALRAALDGTSVLAGVLSLSLPSEHEAFVAVAQGAPLSWAASLHLLFVEWFGGLLFARTWPLALIGAGLYLVRWARRTGLREGGDASIEPGGEVDTHALVVTIPLLLLGAYLVLAWMAPFVFFTRFFWIVAAAATLLAGYGAVAVATYAPLPGWGRATLVGVFAVALLADRYDDFRWREQLSLAPFEDHAALAEEGVRVIADEARCAGPAVVPLAYLPLAAWRAPDKIRRGELCALEDWAAGRGCARPTCVLVMPAAPTTEVARAASARLLEANWAVEVSDPRGALLRQRDQVVQGGTET